MKIRVLRAAGEPPPQCTAADARVLVVTALLLLGALSPSPGAAASPLPAVEASAQELTLVCGGGPCRVPGALALPDRAGEIVVENLDPRAAVTPYLHRADWPDLRSDRAILASILSPGMSPEAKALALWQFVRSWRFSCSPASQESQQLHDPVKLVNVFGCGLCDDTNAALATLARLAGMPSRLWGLGGHVVMEVWYGGGWHLLDAADGVYFRDDRGAIAGVAALARSPGLIASAGNRELRRPNVLRMAGLLAHGAGPTAAGHRAAVQKHFAARFRGFLAQRGEERGASGPAERVDPADLDRLVFAHYADLVASTADNAVSQWWDTAGSEHGMALALHPGDRLVYELRPVGEAGMGCYLGADACFDASGRLERAALAPLLQPVAEGRQPVIAESLPYAVEAFALEGAALPSDAVFDVYLALDGAGWRPIGSVTGGSGSSPSRPSPSTILDYTFPPETSRASASS